MKTRIQGNHEKVLRCYDTIDKCHSPKVARSRKSKSHERRVTEGRRAQRQFKQSTHAA